MSANLSSFLSLAKYRINTHVSQNKFSSIGLAVPIFSFERFEGANPLAQICIGSHRRYFCHLDSFRQGGFGRIERPAVNAHAMIKFFADRRNFILLADAVYFFPPR